MDSFGTEKLSVILEMWMKTIVLLKFTMAAQIRIDIFLKRLNFFLKPSLIAVKEQLRANVRELKFKANDYLEVLSSPAITRLVL